MLTMYKNTQALPWLVISASLLFLLGFIIGGVLTTSLRLILDGIILVLLAGALYLSWRAGRSLVATQPTVHGAAWGQDPLQNNLYLTYLLNVFLAGFLAYVAYGIFTH